MPKVPNTIKRCESEDKPELPKPEARITGQLLEVSEVVEGGHRERYNDEEKNVQYDASEDQAEVPGAHLVRVNE